MPPSPFCSGITALATALYTNESLTYLQLRETGAGQAGCAELAKAVPFHG